MRTLDLGRAQPKQTLFLRDKHRHIAYGGARGGGKSWAVRTKAKLLAFRYPGIKILIVRKTYKELQNNHIEQLTAELAGFAKYNRSDKMFRFPNGSTISFGYCANEGDLGQYQGAEYDVVFIDEAGQLQESWIRKINLCVRGTNGFPKRTYYTLNPGGPGHAYFKRVFVDRNFNPDERPDDYFLSRQKWRTTRHSWTRSRIICVSWRTCRRRCGQRGRMAGGTSMRDSSLRTSGTIRNTTRTGAGHMSLSRSRSRTDGRFAGATTSAMENRSPARGGRSTMTERYTGSWSCTAVRGRRTRA